jgi:transcriptional regulator with XRE-family HTH domain
MNHYTGADLRAERARHGVLQREIASRLGCTVGRVSAVENSIRVTPRLAARYLAALSGSDPALERLARASRELLDAAEGLG